MSLVKVDERGFSGPAVLISQQRYNLLMCTEVRCWTCNNAVRIGDAFAEDLGWGAIESPLDDDTNVASWECPTCAEPEEEMRE